MNQLQDTDPMPFGKFAGQPMQDVPAQYLHWLWSNGKKQDKNDPVADYIRRNLSALKQEYRDGIWQYENSDFKNKTVSVSCWYWLMWFN